VSEAPTSRLVPQTPEDLDDLLFRMGQGESLRSICASRGWHNGATPLWLYADPVRAERYAHARRARVDHLMEEALIFGRAAATKRELPVGDGGKLTAIDPKGARVYADTVFKAVARMDPMGGPVKRVHVSGSLSGQSDEDIAAELDALAAGDLPDEQPLH
jgi:hypothetical protein